MSIATQVAQSKLNVCMFYNHHLLLYVHCLLSAEKETAGSHKQSFLLL